MYNIRKENKNDTFLDILNTIERKCLPVLYNRACLRTYAQSFMKFHNELHLMLMDADFRISSITSGDGVLLFLGFLGYVDLGFCGRNSTKIYG